MRFAGLVPLENADATVCRYDSLTTDARAHTYALPQWLQTPLHKAAHDGFLAIADTLLAANVDVNAQDKVLS